MSVSLATLQTIAPTLAARADALTWLTMSFAEHRADEWGNVYVYAMAYHCAHCMTMFMRSEQQAVAGTYTAPVGPLTGATAGKVSESYGSVSARAGEVSVSDQDYQATSYGRRYLSLRNSRGRAPFVVTVETQ